MEKIKVVIDHFKVNGWGYFMRVPGSIRQKFGAKRSRRVLVQLPGVKAPMHSGLMPIGDGDFSIYLNKDLAKNLDLKLGDSLVIGIDEDRSEYGALMPEELGELLLQDEIGNKYFHALTKGKQRTLIHMVTNLKRSESRLRKAVDIVDYLRWTQGLLDFKQLNLWFKGEIENS